MFAATIAAQTSIFTFQGKLNDNSVPANGSYDLQFRLFDALANGSQIGATLTKTNVQVVNGVFTVQLDFGGAAFDGADKFLEISVKRPSDTAFTTLAPLQQITSAPYSMQAANSATASVSNDSQKLGGIPASQFVRTNDARLSDARVPLPGSSNYLQNTSNHQTGTNFNIDGNGTLGGTLSANAINAQTQFNIAGSRVLSADGASNLFAGFRAGLANASGTFNNSFFGTDAGRSNAANYNSFFGRSAGYDTTTGGSNSFFGVDAGRFNTTGDSNVFIGYSAGSNNSTGTNNTIIGKLANLTANNLNYATAIGAGATVSTDNTIVLGRSNGTDTVIVPGKVQAANFNTNLTNTFAGISTGANNSGFSNSFFGFNAGNANTSGKFNTFIGKDAGLANTTGSSNTLIGESANVGSGNLSYATAIGAEATVSSSNTIALGRSTGADSVKIYGSLDVFGANGSAKFNSGIFSFATIGTLDVSVVKISGDFALTSPSSRKLQLGNSLYFDSVDIPAQLNTGNISAQSIQTTSSATVGGNLYLPFPQTGGSQQVCFSSFNNSKILAFCSSSLRYKTNVADYSSGLNVIDRLRPIVFDWKSDGMHDLGFGAEEVAKVDPLLATYNDKGEVEGVKYDRISAALVNAVKEQQAEIQAQKERIREQQKQIDELKTIVCAMNSNAAVCQK